MSNKVKTLIEIKKNQKDETIRKNLQNAEMIAEANRQKAQDKIDRVNRLAYEFDENFNHKTISLKQESEDHTFEIRKTINRATSIENMRKQNTQNKLDKHAQRIQALEDKFKYRNTVIKEERVAAKDAAV